MESIAVIPEAIVRDIYIKECAQMLQMDDKILVSEVAKRREKHADDEAKRKEREKNRQQDAPSSSESAPDDNFPPPVPEEWNIVEPKPTEQQTTVRTYADTDDCPLW